MAKPSTKSPKHSRIQRQINIGRSSSCHERITRGRPSPRWNVFFANNCRGFETADWVGGGGGAAERKHIGAAIRRVSKEHALNENEGTFSAQNERIGVFAEFEFVNPITSVKRGTKTRLRDSNPTFESCPNSPID